MKAQSRNTSVCYGAGSSQNPSLGLGHSLVTSTLSKAVAAFPDVPWSGNWNLK